MPMNDHRLWKKHPKLSLFFLSAAVLFAVVCAWISADSFFGITTRRLMNVCGVSEFSAKADAYPLSVHFINVGHGDSILICCGGHAALIDTGSFSLNADTRNYLEHCDIERLDYCILSHTDSDHIGDFSSIADEISIESVMFSRYALDDGVVQGEAQKRLYERIEVQHIALIVPQVGDIYPLGEARLEVLSPSKNYFSTNDNSLVIRLEYGDVSFLFTGDAGEQAEEDLLASGMNLHADVLKVSHHGSKTGTSQAFLEAVQPACAVISVGSGHPSLPDRGVVERLYGCDAEVYRTDRDGTVILASDGEKIYSFTEFPPSYGAFVGRTSGIT